MTHIANLVGGESAKNEGVGHEFQKVYKRKYRPCDFGFVFQGVTKTGYIDELNDEELLQLIKDSYLVKEYFKWTLDGPQELQKLAVFEIEMMVALREKRNYTKNGRKILEKERF